MPRTVAPGVLCLDREDWGADTSLPRLGDLIDPLEATKIIEHHTVQKDTDDTPNVYEHVSEAVVQMRKLQTIRPDLGLDVPYSWVRALMLYSNGVPGIVLMEGRGHERRGAHTMFNNRTGRATATIGNLQLPTELLRYVPMINQGWGWLKHEFGLDNLGTVTPAGRIAFGHRDFRDPNDRRTWTLCPGQSLMDVIQLIRPELYAPPVLVPEEDGMKVYRTHGFWGTFEWLSDGHMKYHAFNGTKIRARQAAGFLPELQVVAAEDLAVFNQIPTGPAIL